MGNEKSSIAQKNIFDDIVVVLFDENNKNRLFDCQLRQFVETIRKFSSITDCEEYLQHEITNQNKVFLILFNQINEHFLSQINQNISIQSVYLFYKNSNEYQYWTNRNFQCQKILFSKIDQFSKQLKQDIQDCQNNSIHFNLTNQQLNKLPPRFMYSKLLKEILLNIQYDQQICKKDFLNYCLKHFDYSNQIKIIEEFENDYEKHSPIWWYTRECFIYYILNKALRTENIDLLILMGFFIRDLHQQIENLYKTQKYPRSIRVYRGQGMTNQQFEKFNQYQNGLISFEYFLSTTRDKRVSFRFAQRALEKPGLRGIIFQIKINRKLTKYLIPFASIQNLSYFNNDEKEILFSTHTVFRIISIRSLNNQKTIWQINLRFTTNQQDIQLEQLTKHFRDDLQLSDNPRESLAKLLFTMGFTNKSEDIYQNILINTSENDYEQLAYLYHQLGCISYQQNDFIHSLQYFEKSLQIKKRIYSDQSNHPQLADTLLNIGSIYQQQDKFDQALFYFDLTLKTKTNNQNILASIYNNMAIIYKTTEQYSKALESFEEALQIDLNHLPSTHPDLAITYFNIGQLYLATNDSSNALLFFRKALHICRLSLPDNHPILLTTINNYQETLALLPTNLIQNHSIYPSRLTRSRNIFKFLGHFLHIR